MGAFFKKYSGHPFSLIMAILIHLAALITVGVLFALVAYILIRGVANLSPELFAWTYNTDNVSMMPAIINTVIIMLLSLLIATPIGIFSAIYLVEYAKKGNKVVKWIRMTTETLAGIPSIVFGLFGYLMFVLFLHFGYSLLAGALTLSLMVLPTIMRTTEEALRAVPDSYREASFGLGAGHLRTIFKIILPSAMHGILSGIILSIGRIFGETAALIYTTGTAPVIYGGLLDSGRTLAWLVDELKRRGAASVEVMALLQKPSRREVDVDVKYSGYEIPDEFVVGFGLDYAERYRNLDSIAVLKPAVYQGA